MTNVIDLWRAVDPEARLVSGATDRLRTAVRGVARSRAAPPHLPEEADGRLLVLEAGLVPPAAGLDGLIAILREAGLRPSAIVLTGLGEGTAVPDRAGADLPVLASGLPTAAFAEAAERHLEAPDVELRRVAGELRLAAAEAALADPDPATAAGLVAARLRRGVAVIADGELRALHARPAGRALAARFAALHARLLAEAPARATLRQSREGLHLMERRIRPAASVWLFDDLPFARVDEAAAEALTITLRALLRRPEVLRPPLRPLRLLDQGPAVSRQLPAPAAPDLLRDTLLAVARANGRVATAARELGVHRNTVLYRLRRAASELGVDPRRPADALALLREADEAAH